jgi:DNA-binding NarL/FixJ family response regulator
MPTPIRVAIISGDRMFQEVLTVLVSGSAGMEVVPCEGDPGDPHNAATNGADGSGVDVVLVDAADDPKRARARLLAVKDRWAEAEAVVLGIEQEDESVVDFFEAGAHSYVLQGASPEGLIGAVRDVHERRSPSAPLVVSAVLRRINSLAGVPVPPPRTTEPLTPREMEILVLLARGLGNKEICRRLHVTVQTVKNHVHSVLAKFQVHRRREAVRLAYEMGLLIESPGDTDGRSGAAGKA